MPCVDGIGVLFRAEAGLVVTACNPMLWNHSTQNPFFIFHSTSDEHTGLWENFKCTVNAPWIQNSYRQCVYFVLMCLCLRSLTFQFSGLVCIQCVRQQIASEIQFNAQFPKCLVYFSRTSSGGPECSTHVQTHLNKSQDVITIALTHQHKRLRAGGCFCTLQVIWCKGSEINKACEVTFCLVHQENRGIS